MHGLPQPLPTVLQQVSKETAPFIASSQRLLVILVQHLAVLMSVKKQHENNLTVLLSKEFFFPRNRFFYEGPFLKVVKTYNWYFTVRMLQER